jgi:aminomethyltransferase
MLKQTPLNGSHRLAGAKLVDFAGWEMPLHYGSQIEEHHRVRRDAGMFDVSHMMAVDVSGSDAHPFLRYLLANNVDKLASAGKALYSCMLNAAGGVLDDLIVYGFGDDRFRLVVNAGTAEQDLLWLRQVQRDKSFRVDISPRRDLSIVAVQGPNARSKFWRALPSTMPETQGLAPFSAVEAAEFCVARTGYTGEDGFELMLPAARAEEIWRALTREGVSPVGLGARDTLRLEAGMNLHGQDMDASITPFECGLGWTVDLKSERDFIGRAALIDNGAEVRQAGLVLLDKGVLRSHQSVATHHGAGLTTSGGYAPTLNRSIALARVPNAVAAGDIVQVSIRDKPMNARVVKPPFARNGQGLIEELG